MSICTQKPIVIKVSGKLFSDTQGYAELIKSCKSLQQSGYQIVIIHGGGVQLDSHLKAMGRPIEKLDGLRVSSKQDMPIITGVLAGQLNKQLVCDFAKQQAQAIGISLMDFGLATCRLVNAKLGQVGEPISGNATPLIALLNSGLIPVIASVGIDEYGEPCNVNADHAAVHVAKLLSASLLLLSDVEGVLGKDAKVISQLSESDIRAYSNAGIITDGMLVKVQAAFEASQTLKSGVFIGSWYNLFEKVTGADLTCGTLLIPSANDSAYSSSTKDTNFI